MCLTWMTKFIAFDRQHTLMDNLFELKTTSTSEPATQTQTQRHGPTPGPISASVPAAPLENPPSALTATANQNQPVSLDEKLEIRCDSDTLEKFLIVRAKYKSHYEALNALIDFYNQAGGAKAMVKLKGRTI
jgi:hypothetical protein